MRPAAAAKQNSRSGQRESSGGPCGGLGRRITFSFLSDLELFVCDGLKGENLGKKAKERREALIRRIKEVKVGYVRPPRGPVSLDALVPVRNVNANVHVLALPTGSHRTSRTEVSVGFSALILLVCVTCEGMSRRKLER